MSEHQRETAFLRQVILYDNTAESHKLEERIAQAQRDDCCVRHAMWWLTLLAALAAAGLGYSAVLLSDYPENIEMFFTRFIVQVFCVLGLASLISLLIFMGLGVGYRKNLFHLREEGRRLASKLLESRLGMPAAKTLVGVVKPSEVVVNRNEACVSAPVQVELPKEAIEAGASLDDARGPQQISAGWMQTS